MTSGRSGSDAGFDDALVGADGTADPPAAPEPGVIFADPLADTPTVGPGQRSRGADAPPDARTRVPGPAPLTNEAIVAAERQLAREQAQRRSAAEQAGRQNDRDRQQADRARRQGLDRARQAAQQRAADTAAARAGQHSQVAGAYQGRTAAQLRNANAGAAGAVRPGPLSKADRAELMNRIRHAAGPERTELLRQLAAGRAKPGAKSWGCLLGFVILVLLATGAGKEIVQAIVDAISNGN